MRKCRREAAKMINKDWQYLILSRVLFTGVRFVARFSRLRLWSAGAPSHGRWAVLGNSLLRVVSSSRGDPLHEHCHELDPAVPDDRHPGGDAVAAKEEHEDEDGDAEEQDSCPEGNVAAPRHYGRLLF